MSEKNTNVPKIRFPGFTGEWEQRRLKEISDKVIEKNKDNLFTETLTNSAEFGIINQRDFFDKDISNKKNLNGYYVVREDDFVYNPRISNFAPVGPVKRNKLGRTGVMSPLYYVFRTRDIHKTYLEYFFYSTGWHNFMRKNGDSGARADRFAIKDSVFMEMPIPFPDSDEQAEIGTFFSNLDHLITLHQCKLNHLQDKKKSLLQKMFPENGADVPEIRFPGFTDAWEQRKLGDEVLEIVAGGDIDKNKISTTGKYPVLANALTNDGIVGYYQGGFRIKAPAVTITGRGDVGHAKARKFDFTPVVRLLSIKSNHDVDFLENAINNHKVLVESTGVPQLTVPQLAKYEIHFPDVIDEEKIIGAFFLKFNNLITLHQRKLNHLQEQKKSLFQQMFI